MPILNKHQRKLREIFKDHCFYSEAAPLCLPYFQPVNFSRYANHEDMEHHTIKPMLEECKNLPDHEVYKFFEHELRMEAYVKFSRNRRSPNFFARNREMMPYLKDEKSFASFLDKKVEKDLKFIKNWFQIHIL